ncbi:MAG: hypothetical protein KDD43_12195, partial [Bdellovibrionales bacterium]|nr:hypothetical protein [Bdellovibrionales bacterium]
MNRVRVAFLFLLLMGLLEIRASLYPNFYPPGFAVAQVDEESAELLRKIPFFAKTEMKRIKVSVVVDK